MSTVALPQPTANPPIPRKDIVFSHPSEEEFARVLDFYGIEWRYEPTTFPLEWDEQGAVTVAFSPDFYLVHQELYIELTTLRSRLMRIKHQKIRRMQALYPDVRVRLWSRSDFERFLERLGIAERGPELIGKEAVNNHGA
ncbi:MAG: hypothetical protein GX557_03410 [Chloroflexi bacterium]|nr:hypothetical protein [Chloroflexota bacterium]